jgi:hypothetical protein
MIVYLVVSPTSPVDPKLESAIATQFKDNFLRLNTNAWFVASTKTARAVADQLEITDGKNGLAIVGALGDYFGRLNRDVWAWIKVKLETPA